MISEPGIDTTARLTATHTHTHVRTHMHTHTHTHTDTNDAHRLGRTEFWDVGWSAARLTCYARATMLASVGSGLRGGLFPLVVIGRPRVSQNSSTFATVCITCVCFMASMMDVFQYPHCSMYGDRK